MNQIEGKRLAIQGPKPEKKQLSPFKPTSSSSIVPIQNRFTPITPVKRQPSYSSLVQKPVTISPDFTPRKSIILPKTQTITPQSFKNTKSSSKETSNSYVQNPVSQTIKILEEEEIQIFNQGFQSLTDFLFPKNSMFIGSEIKPREYYQAILESTGSVKITHSYNSTQNPEIAYSRVHILRVLSVQEWKARPYTDKTTNYPKHPYFNYYDYQDAWYNLFYLKNYSHSWFVFFDRNFECSYPKWFVRWFRFLGNIPETLPEPVSEGFKKFKEIFYQNIPEFEYLLQFSILFKIPWIISWTFSVAPASNTSPCLLQRMVRVKWWDKFPEDQLQKMTVQGVSEYYSLNYENSNSKDNQISREEDNEDKEIERFLATSSKEELKKLINQIKRESSSSGSSVNQDTEIIQDAQDPFSNINIYE